MNSTQAFLKARNFLLENRDNYTFTYKNFRWPELTEFNWALDWFDVYAKNNSQPALHIVGENGVRKISYSEMSETSSRVAQAFLKLGLSRGDRILIMLGNHEALWESVLAAQKLGLVVIPTATQATSDDLKDRVSRGKIKAIFTDSIQAHKFNFLGADSPTITIWLKPSLPPASQESDLKSWISFEDLRSENLGTIPGTTQASDAFLLYFTSGTAAKPKLVLHTHQSYPVGHLSTMYWIGIREKSIHQNISSPRMGKNMRGVVFLLLGMGAPLFSCMTLPDLILSSRWI